MDGYNLLLNKRLETPGRYLATGFTLRGDEDMYEMVDLINKALREMYDYEEAH